MTDVQRKTVSVDGLVTGWHEPESTHLLMLESFAVSMYHAVADEAHEEMAKVFHDYPEAVANTTCAPPSASSPLATSETDPSI